MPSPVDFQSRGLGRGFTLVELVVVATVIAMVAAIAVPNLIASRMDARESVAVATMRGIASAQAQFWRSNYADEDFNGDGEYGTLAELCGRVPIRGSGARKAPAADLSPSMGDVTPDGEVRQSGYVYRMYLPEHGGTGRREKSLGGMDPHVLSTTLAQRHWACYAWPEHYGASGAQTFFINERGEICAADDPRYTSAGCAGLRAGAAFVTGNPDSITGQIAIGTLGSDGNLWKTTQ